MRENPTFPWIYLHSIVPQGIYFRDKHRYYELEIACYALYWNSVARIRLGLHCIWQVAKTKLHLAQHWRPLELSIDTRVASHLKSCKCKAPCWTTFKIFNVVKTLSGMICDLEIRDPYNLSGLQLGTLWSYAAAS